MLVSKRMPGSPIKWKRSRGPGVCKGTVVSDYPEQGYVEIRYQAVPHTSTHRVLRVPYERIVE